MSLFSDVAPVRYRRSGKHERFCLQGLRQGSRGLGKRMADWLRLTVCYWHSFSSAGQGHVRLGNLAAPVAGGRQ